ncbi:MAG: drug/metabolite transporter (DMT)-like permease [Cognaticolwellia sp.]
MNIAGTQQHKASIELLLLAAIWGASFMFMRVGAPEFGPIVFTTLRTGIAAIFLIMCLVLFKETKALKGRWRDIFVVGR